jgi:hypothetical protein
MITGEINICIPLLLELLKQVCMATLPHTACHFEQFAQHANPTLKLSINGIALYAIYR